MKKMGFIRIYEDVKGGRGCVHVYQRNNGHIYLVQEVVGNSVVAAATPARPRNFGRLLSACDFGRRLSTVRYGAE